MKGKLQKLSLEAPFLLFYIRHGDKNPYRDALDGCQKLRSEGDDCLSKEKGVEEMLPRKGSLVLVEFKVPRNLLEEFDSKWKSSRFSSRSEAIRFLLRTFVEEASERSQYSITSIRERV